MCLVTSFHFSSLVTGACYVFIKLKAQQGSNKCSFNRKCLIPQEICMPIFLKPSHKTRISMCKYCVCVCVYVCMYFDSSQVLTLFRRPCRTRLLVWMIPGSEGLGSSWVSRLSQEVVTDSVTSVTSSSSALQLLCSVRHKCKAKEDTFSCSWGIVSHKCHQQMTDLGGQLTRLSVMIWVKRDYSVKFV